MYKKEWMMEKIMIQKGRLFGGVVGNGFKNFFLPGRLEEKPSMVKTRHDGGINALLGEVFMHA